MLLHLFQEDCTEAVHVGQLTPGRQDIAFLRIEAHPPFLGPILQVFQVFLQVIRSWGVLMFRYNRQSSAKRLTLDYTASGKSLMWHRKSNGPSTLPWGTPESTVASPDASPVSTTRIFLLVKKLVGHL